METAIIVIIGLVVLLILLKIFKALLKWVIIILILGVVVAYFTNPEESIHRDNLAVKTKELSIKKIRQKLVTIDDYKLFSLTKITVEGETKIVGIGAFGRVWYFDDLKEKLQRK
jgi:uncharacterized membrane protein YqgA involved in biofilm formation